MNKQVLRILEIQCLKGLFGRLTFSVHQLHNNLTLPAYKGGSSGAKPPWLRRLGKVLLVRIVKNVVVVVYSSANSLTPSVGRF